MKILAITDIGLVRKENQDCYTYSQLSDELAFAVVCDGMGGEGGSVASQIATQTFSSILTRDLKPHLSYQSVKSIVASAVSVVNALILDKAKQVPEFYGMGTTLAMAIIDGQKLYIAHIGDSRIYKIDHTTQQLTTDHSIVQNLIDSGNITADQAKVHPDRHIITRVLGVMKTVQEEFEELTIEGGTYLLLCSDGISNHISQKQLEVLVQTCSEQNCMDQFVECVNQDGGSDNMTALLIAV